MLYHNDWCKVIKENDKISIIIDATKKDLIETINSNPNEIKKNLINSCIKVVGNNPAVCLSGGIDSQAMINVWLESGIKFTPFTFKFSNGLNQTEYNDALRFSKDIGINLEVLEVDVLRFLQQDNINFAKKYKLSSPQFSIHCKFLEMIKEQGYSGAVLGGNGLLIETSRVRFNYSFSQLSDIENYSRITNFPIISNFLGFDKNFCLLLALYSKTTPDLDTATDINLFGEISHQSSQGIRYESKIKSYRNMGFHIRPQKYKKTGFEELKNFFNESQNSFYAFESTFRMPMIDINKPVNVNSFVKNKDFENYLLELTRDQRKV